MIIMMIVMMMKYFRRPVEDNDDDDDDDGWCNDKNMMIFFRVTRLHLQLVLLRKLLVGRKHPARSRPSSEGVHILAVSVLSHLVGDR